MTNGRRGPRRGGDQGQRYAVCFKSSDATPEIVFGWSDSLEGAQAMVDRINRHPNWHSPHVIDRQLPHSGGPTAS